MAAGRTYSMGRRSVAAGQTREHILDVAADLLTARWYDDVKLADIARAADVALQTVANHFSTKERLYLLALTERVAPQIEAVRREARPGDIDSIVTAAVAAYERSGSSIVRMLALAERYPALQEAAHLGRVAHRDWIRTIFAPQLARRSDTERDDLTRQLALILDVYSWYQLRHHEDRDESGTAEDLRALLTCTLAQPGGAESGSQP